VSAEITLSSDQSNKTSLKIYIISLKGVFIALKKMQALVNQKKLAD